MMFDINPTLKNSLTSQPLWRSRRGEKRIKIFPFFTQFSLGRLKVSRFYPTSQEHVILREITALHKRYFHKLKNKQRNKVHSRGKTKQNKTKKQLKYASQALEAVYRTSFLAYFPIHHHV